MTELAPGSRPTASAGCHGDGPAAWPSDGQPVVALVGSPNVGKSSLFNTLTGARRTVGNWAGTSVEVGSGGWRVGDRQVTLIDLPGAYSLDPISPDEALTRELLVAPPDGGSSGPGRPDLVVVLVSAADLARTLYLACQVREQPLRVVIAMSMVDVATRRGIALDPEALAAELGVPVVPVDARRGSAHGLVEAVATALAGPVPPPMTAPGPGSGIGSGSGRGSAPGDPRAVQLGDDDALATADRRFARVARAVEAGTRHSGHARVTWSDRVDRVATSPVVGPMLFLAVMWAVFQLTTRVAAPVQGLLDGLVSGPVSTGLRWLFAAVGLGGGWVEGLVVDGVVAGVGMLLTFVPLMAIMFTLLAVLEDSGYLARAAVVTDRLMRAVGLPGRAFLPLVVGFGCNVPAESATRVLPDARQRLLTVLLVPFTSCSARLTVYVLVASTFFGAHAGDVVFGMYVLSIVLVVLAGLLLRATLLRAV